MYCIIKLMKNSNGIELPVVLLDNQDEVWEFQNADEAIKIAVVVFMALFFLPRFFFATTFILGFTFDFIFDFIFFADIF